MKPIHIPPGEGTRVNVLGNALPWRISRVGAV